MHYTPEVDLAFSSVEHIMRDVQFGWFLRYSHSNGASIFFIVVYAHIVRGLLFGSYLMWRKSLWCTGIVIFLLMILTAFLGYILPWGQMSLWGATVITNLASTIPKVGESIVLWLWGGFSVANPTLNRFYSLHFFFPFIILAFVGAHIYLLHLTGSSNPLGIKYALDKLGFGSYYTVKDFFSLFPFVFMFCCLVFFLPNYLGHPDNYIPANPSLTPEHIVPEWYFLPFYAILRAIPSKAFGVIALLSSIVGLFILPFVHKARLRSISFKPMYKSFIFTFLALCLLLGVLGSKPIEQPYLNFSEICTLIYFYFILSLIQIDNLDAFFLYLTEIVKMTVKQFIKYNTIYVENN
jgi:quinol-cytochrome oxidoreductase complex cytochrome b subunit